MDPIMMKCGHRANATTADGKPFCLICDCYEVEEKKPDLKGRKAKCSYCGRIEDSKTTLPFFKTQPNEKYDSYYCGCEGWD